MIDHRLLAFEAVLQEGGFERAARRLALTQSAVSQRVKLLEAELGQVLLVRSKPVHPTPAGRRLLPYLSQLRLIQNGLQGRQQELFRGVNEGVHHPRTQQNHFVPYN